MRLRDAARERRHARVVRRARPRQVDDLLVQDAAGARPHQHDAVGEAHGLADVVRDEDDGLARRAPDALDLALQDLPRLRVERRERLVHEQHGGIGRQRARDGAALAHPAGELVGVAILEAPEVHEAQELLAPRGPRARRQALELERELDVVAQGEPREERRVLEDDGPVRPRAGDDGLRPPARAPTWAGRDRRRGSGSWTCRSRTDRAGRRTRRPRRAARRRAGSRRCPSRTPTLSETSSRAMATPGARRRAPSPTAARRRRRGRPATPSRTRTHRRYSDGRRSRDTGHTREGPRQRS